MTSTGLTAADLIAVLKQVPADTPIVVYSGGPSDDFSQAFEASICVAGRKPSHKPLDMEAGTLYVQVN